MNFAIIGCGRHAQQKFLFIDRYIDDLRLIKVCDQDQSVLQTVKALRSNVYQTKSIDELYNDDSLDFIVIATDPKSHFLIAQKCIEAGKNILIEKPMTATLEEADRLIELHRNHPVKVMVGYHRRFGKPEQKLAEIVHSGILEKVIAIQVTHNFNDESRFPYSRYLSNIGGRLGGVIYEYLSHEIDFLRFLFPEVNIRDIHLFRRSIRHEDDTVMIQFYLDNDIIASYFLSSISTDFEEYRVFGTEGQVIFNRYKNLMPVYYSRKQLLNRPLRLISEWIDGIKSIGLVMYTIKSKILHPYIKEIDYFVKCIRNNVQPECSLAEGRFVMEVIDRIYSLI